MTLFKKSLLAGGIALFGSVGVANAASYTVNVWNGAPNGVASTTQADLLTPTSAALASFTFTGPIAFKTNAQAGNTMGDFFASGGGTISNFTSSLSLNAFNATVMSASGDTIDTYLQILGSYYGSPGTIGTISHDGGASFYSGNPGSYTGSQTCPTQTLGADYCSPGEIGEVLDTFALSGTGLTNFDLIYVSANGGPSNLNFSISVAAPVPVPEPFSLALLGVGLVGLSVTRRRKTGAA
jgi:hypothetical protein